MRRMLRCGKKVWGDRDEQPRRNSASRARKRWRDVSARSYILNSPWQIGSRESFGLPKASARVWILLSAARRARRIQTARMFEIELLCGVEVYEAAAHGAA